MVNIRDERKKLKLTQIELAEKVGLHQSTIANAERNRYNLSVKVAKKLAELFNCKWTEFYE